MKRTISTSMERKGLSFLLSACMLIPFMFSSPAHAQQYGGVWFEENSHQYPSQVRYKAEIGQGTTVFLENDRFTFVKFDPAQVEKIHEESHKDEKARNTMVDFHAFYLQFTGAAARPQINATGRSSFYYNYFKGNDPSHWAPEVYSWQEVTYSDLYPGVDMHAYSSEQHFKYDFIVDAGADPSLIQMQFTGANQLLLHDNQLIIQTGAGNIVEQSPFTYQLINGKKTEVPCRYILSADGTTVSFHFPQGYNKSLPLVIDPVLVAASYSGAPNGTTTYGHCATYDLAGNIYTGGECFNPGYPTSAGAFQAAFGGVVDIAVAKLNANGSALIWASYAGGSSQDVPNSLVVNDTEELYVLGATQSPNYPVSAGAFDNAYTGAHDIVVTHFNTTGTALVGSTYIGGAGDDGGGFMPWSMNGHDGMRGEIITDAAGNAWVASFTASPDFPTTAGTADATLNGTWDGCVFRLSPDMSTLQWSTYLGGAGDDGSYGLRINNAGEIFVTGITQSNDFPATPGSYAAAAIGGSDAYVAKFNAAGTSVTAATYFGTPQNEIGYFIALDLTGDVYIYGSTQGNVAITPGAYGNAGSGNYVAKFASSLNTLAFSTVFGNGGAGHLEPEAFMVDECNNIYMSGFGGDNNYPITPNALFTTQAAANFGSCYFMVLSSNAASLVYGSLYYGSHVDGGTSRFDPSGVIYQGICMGGGSAATPPWAYKDNTNAPGWDMFVVKINFETVGIHVSATASPNDTVCFGTAIQFENTGEGSNFLWNFGDGSPTSNQEDPLHTYATTGTFQVYFVASDTTGCGAPDTTFLTIMVDPKPTVALGPDTSLCTIQDLTLFANAEHADHYLWSTGDTTGSVVVNSTGVYSVSVNNDVCPDMVSDSIFVEFVTGYDSLYEVPNVFTPNGDGWNDRFDVGNFPYETFNLYIYDRWGLLVFESSDPTSAWDGRVNNSDASEGVYYWIANVKHPCSNDGEKLVEHGFLTVFR